MEGINSKWLAYIFFYPRCGPDLNDMVIAISKICILNAKNRTTKDVKRPFAEFLPSAQICDKSHRLLSTLIEWRPSWTCSIPFICCINYILLR